MVYEDSGIAAEFVGRVGVGCAWVVFMERCVWQMVVSAGLDQFFGCIVPSLVAMWYILYWHGYDDSCDGGLFDRGSRCFVSFSFGRIRRAMARVVDGVWYGQLPSVLCTWYSRMLGIPCARCVVDGLMSLFRTRLTVYRRRWAR